MGITREQFKILAKAMKAIYTDERFLPDHDAVNVWYTLLCDFDYETLSKAIQKHMMSSTFIPTVADIRTAASQFKPSGEIRQMSELDAWVRVRKAISNSIYNAESEFSKLLPVIQKAVGSPHNLEEWATLDTDTVNSVIQSNFLRSYRAEVARETELQKLSPAVRDLIEKASNAAIEEKDVALIGGEA